MSKCIKGCSVCNDENDIENPITKCGKCDLQVHVLCYGIKNVDNFVCSPCNDQASDAQCAICNKLGGAMKKTTDNRWAHVLCTFFISDARFVDTDTMEPVDVTKIRQPKKKLPCVFCNDTFGTLKCCKCSKGLHAPCGFEHNTLIEEVNSDDTIAFLGYCDKHKPVRKSRLSSEGLNAAVKLKTKKQIITQSNKDNSSWIIEKISSQSNANAGPSSAESGVANENHDLSKGSSVESVYAPNFLDLDIVDDTTQKNDCTESQSFSKNTIISDQSTHDSHEPIIADSSCIDLSSHDYDKNEDKNDSMGTMGDSENSASTTKHECYKDAIIKKVSRLEIFYMIPFF